MAAWTGWYPTFRMGRPKFDHRDPQILQDVSSNYDSPAAACHRFWEASVDGIYLYDWHTHNGPTDPRDYGTIPQVGEASVLARHDKLYRINTDYSRNAAISACCLPGQLPLAFTVQAGPTSARLNFSIADDPRSASRISLRAQWRQAIQPRQVSWRLNGDRIPEVRPVGNKEGQTNQVSELRSATIPALPEQVARDTGWTEYLAQSSRLKKGNNVLEVTVAGTEGADPTQPVELLQVRVAITYK